MDKLNATQPETLTDWLQNANQLLTKIEAKPDYQKVLDAVEASEPLDPQVMQDLRLIQTLQRCTHLVSEYVQLGG
jgi:hypothetical protein